MTRHNFGLTLIFLVLALIFSACSSADAATINAPSPTIQETAEIAVPDTGSEPVVTEEVVVTAEPTLIPTEEPTAVVTEVIEPTPTLEPTPTPTEVPMYIGLSAGEVEAIRAQCLKQNPDSLCLPLPFNPEGATLTWETEEWSIEQFIYVGTAEKGSQVVLWDDAVLKPGDSVDPGLVAALLEAGLGFSPSDFESRGTISAVSSYLHVVLSEGATVVSPLGEFVSYDLDADPSAPFYGTKFEWELSGLAVHASRPDPNGTETWHVLPFEAGEVSLFEAEPHPTRWADGIEYFGRNLVVGEVVSEIRGSAELNVFFNNVRMPDVGCDECAPGRPPRAGEQAWRDGLFEDDLLRNDAGSIVYVLPNP